MSAAAIYVTCRELNKIMGDTLDGTKIEQIQGTINDYAISAAVAGLVGAAVPGVASVVALVTQGGFVWATYVKINKTLGISMSEHMAKFIGTAVLTNIAASAGSTLIVLAGAAIFSFIPIFGQVAGAAVFAAAGYIMVYAAAIIYLKIITKFVKPDGTVDLSEDQTAKDAIKQVVKESDVEGILKEGRSQYKQAKADGSINKAQQKLKCAGCGTTVKPGQRFCSECGHPLS